MEKQTRKIPLSAIVLDESIYPRERIDHKRVAIFAENIRDNFPFDPIEVEPHPEKPGKYRILDGVHRWSAYKATGALHLEVIVVENLNGTDPLLYAAQKAIGPRQLSEEEAKNTARRAFQNNPRLSTELIGKSIGRSRRTVHSYIADLKAATEMELNLKIFRMHRLGIPQKRISKRLEVPQQTISGYLPKMATFPFPPDTCLAFNRRCWTLDKIDRPDKRPEIEPFYWELNGTANLGVLSAKEKPDLIIFDPPYFDKKQKSMPKRAYPCSRGKNT